MLKYRTKRAPRPSSSAFSGALITHASPLHELCNTHVLVGHLEKPPLFPVVRRATGLSSRLRKSPTTSLAAKENDVHQVEPTTSLLHPLFLALRPRAVSVQLVDAPSLRGTSTIFCLSSNSTSEWLNSLKLQFFEFSGQQMLTLLSHRKRDNRVAIVALLPHCFG